VTAAKPSDRDILRMLREAAGPAAEPAPDAPEAQDYEWHRPYRYTPEQTERLRAAGADLADALAAGLADALGEKPELQLRELGEQYGSAIGDALPEGVHVGLEAAEAPAGLVTVRLETAAGWVQRLLGGGAVASGDGDGELSALETELLADLVSAVARACCEHLQAAGASGLAPAGQIVREPLGLVDDADVYCRFAFGIGEGEPSEQGGQGDLVVTLAASRADALLPDADANPRGDADGGAADQSPADPSARVEAHLQSVPFRAAVRLATVEASMRDVAALEPGDVVVLQDLAQPAVLSIQGLDMLAGELVSCQGRRGFRVLGPIRET